MERAQYRWVYYCTFIIPTEVNLRKWKELSIAGWVYYCTLPTEVNLHKWKAQYNYHSAQCVLCDSTGAHIFSGCPVALTQNQTHLLALQYLAYQFLKMYHLLAKFLLTSQTCRWCSSSRLCILQYTATNLLVLTCLNQRNGMQMQASLHAREMGCFFHFNIDLVVHDPGSSLHFLYCICL